MPAVNHEALTNERDHEERPGEVGRQGVGLVQAAVELSDLLDCYAVAGQAKQERIAAVRHDLAGAGNIPRPERAVARFMGVGDVMQRRRDNKMHGLLLRGWEQSWSRSAAPAAS